VNPRIIVRIEELGKVKKFNGFIGNKNLDLPDYSIVLSRKIIIGLFQEIHTSILYLNMVLLFLVQHSSNVRCCSSIGCKKFCRGIEERTSREGLFYRTKGVKKGMNGLKWLYQLDDHSY
jgi:hypothetical protein